MRAKKNICASAHARLFRTINCHVQYFSRSHHIEESIDILKYVVEDLFLRLRRRTVLRVEARVYNSVHVEIEVVELCSVRVGQGCINGNHFVAQTNVPRGQVLDNCTNTAWVPLRQPAVERWNTHAVRLYTHTHTHSLSLSLSFTHTERLSLLSSLFVCTLSSPSPSSFSPFCLRSMSVQTPPPTSFPPPSLSLSLSLCAQDRRRRISPFSVVLVFE